MNLDQLFIFVERLRREAIGEPNWIEDKRVFEYQDNSAKVVAVLKLIRATQGVSSLNMLCRHGLFIDFGVIVRCVNDCIMEAYFLLEEFPNTSSNVNQFVKEFFESTIDGHLSKETSPVPTQKIRSAMVRVLKDRQDQNTRKIIDNVYKTSSGYVHANYAHIMEVYNGHNHDFSLGGVPSIQQRRMRMEFVKLATNSITDAAAFVAYTLDLKDLYHDIVHSWQQI